MEPRGGAVIMCLGMKWISHGPTFMVESGGRVRGRYHSVTIKNVIFDGCHGWNVMDKL